MLKNLTKQQWFIAGFNLAYIIGFGSYYLVQRNYEFLWYVAVLVSFFVLLVFLMQRAQFPTPLLWGLSVWGLLHMAGGGVGTGDHVLYEQMLLPVVERGELLILKYDQVVHAFGFGVTTFLTHHLMTRYVRPLQQGFAYFLIIVMAGTGFGVLNEIVEFLAVLIINETGVGGYYNIALDLVFNTLGATIAALLIYHFSSKEFVSKQRVVT